MGYVTRVNLACWADGGLQILDWSLVSGRPNPDSNHSYINRLK